MRERDGESVIEGDDTLFFQKSANLTIAFRLHPPHNRRQLMDVSY